MARLSIILLLIIVVVLAVVALTSKSKVSKVDQKDFTFTLVAPQGQVEYKSSLDDSYSVLPEGEIELNSGSFVKTLGYPAEVVFSNNNSLSIDTDTEVQVVDEDESTIITQFFGRTWHRITSLTGTAEYQVETPTAVAAVRGTKFAVIFVKDSEESQVLV